MPKDFTSVDVRSYCEEKLSDVVGIHVRQYGILQSNAQRLAHLRGEGLFQAREIVEAFVFGGQSWQDTGNAAEVARACPEQGSDRAALCRLDDFDEVRDLAFDQGRKDSALVCKVVIETTAGNTAGKTDVFHLGDGQALVQDKLPRFVEDVGPTLGFGESCSHEDTLPTHVGNGNPERDFDGLRTLSQETSQNVPTPRETILSALADLLRTVPHVPVLRGDVLPERVPAVGLMILRDGDPGEPGVTLSPLRYHYQHRAEIEAVVQGADHDATFATLCASIGAAISGDCTLGGLCDWVEAEAPRPVDLPVEGAATLKAAVIPIILHYSTADPLA